MNYYSHPTSEISRDSSIGNNTIIWQFCTVLAHAKIGKNCKIGQNVFIEENVLIGDYVTIKNNVALYKGVICENKVFLGPNCVFTNVKNPRSFISRKEKIQATIIREGASIGANATIVCGCEIGEYAIIGAGAVITKNVEPYNLIVGNPGRKIGYVCKCGEKLEKVGSDKYICSECLSEYINIDGNIKCV